MKSKTAQQLNLIHFSLQTGLTSIPDQFPHLSDSAMGCIKNGKVTLYIDKSVTPVAQIYHCVPFHVHK